MTKKKHFAMVKKHRKFTVLFCVVITGICTQFSFISLKKTSDFEEHYLKNIKKFRVAAVDFLQSSRKKKSLTILKQHFVQCRMAYKKMAVLTEHFNFLESSRLNSPALDRLLSDSPTDIGRPDGLQAIEQLLYSEWNQASYKQLDKYLIDISSTIVKLENEPGKSYRSRPTLLWDALRSATLRIIALGITGFDSPVAQLSLPEAKASFEEIKELLPYLKSDKGNSVDSKQLVAQINNAVQYLIQHNNFNSFNRLAFIKQYADPIYKELNRVRTANNIDAPDGANPINFSSTSIFGEDAFNINFFGPSDSGYWVTTETVSLGKKLFYDNIVSGNKDRNCSSCHHPDKAFTDGLKTPMSTDNKTPLLRNSPTLLNAAFQTKFFWDNRVSLLEGQLAAVIHSAEEMKGSVQEAVTELTANREYMGLFIKAYPKEVSPINTFTVINALSAYIRSLTALNARFDKYMRGDASKLSAAEKNGFNLFAGKAKCATCHFIPLFNGLFPPVFNDTESEVLGVPANASKKNPVLDNDEGRKGFTLSPIHKYAFKTPTLRNVELTAPYMHNGVYNTLEEVMEFYNNGGGKGLKIAPPNQTLPFDKLTLSKNEVADVIAFMKTLTDTTSRQYR
jgi:cytochrome c peroxidase